MSNHTRDPITLRDIRARRGDILALTEKYGVTHVRVFGSIARGESEEGSDVDFIVTFPPGTSIFDQVGLWLDLKELLGCDIDLIADHPSGGDVTREARRTAIPI
ncbi:MAG: nucleotidyltransferase domain-containing protein [Chloroflexi bacterium]|nr:nucleotidyltransferase domain-containing protein [Chloroflexota bacterium]